MDTPRSPLTGRRNTKLLQVLEASRLIEGWERAFGIDIRQEIDNVSRIRRYTCMDTGLNFFKPDCVAGSEWLYSELQQFDWYYRTDKWEHRKAAALIPSGSRVLVVGCGQGEFVQRLNSREHVRAKGIELNESAVVEAKRRGRNVHQRDIEEEARYEPEYDVVCHFQVLEHVVDPTDFLSTCLDCVRKQGTVIAAVPNMAGFVGAATGDLLNQPPHHMTQWWPETFASMKDFLPVKLEEVHFEPLAGYHRFWYASTQAKRLKRKFHVAEVVVRGVRGVLSQLLSISALRRRLRGHTQLLVLRES